MITLPYPPSVNRVWRNFRGRMVMSAEGRAYKEAAAWTLKAGGAKVLTGDIEVMLILHPKSNKDGSASKVRIDLDNANKVVFDSMNGVCFEDDSQITRIVAEVGEPMFDGGVSVQVRSINNEVNRG